MTELSLLTKSIKLEIDGQPKADRVVGLLQDGTKALWEFGYRPDGLESEEILSLDNSAVLDNLSDFYERTRAANPDMREFYNCHALVWFALGGIERLQRYEWYDGITYEEKISEGNLEAGRAYGVRADGLINHSILGLNRSNFSLSVLGDNNILAIVDNPTILKAYQGDSLHRMEPYSARTEIES